MDGTWFKSSHSSASGNCVEVRFTGGAVQVRHSRAPRRVLTTTRWCAFVRALRAGALAR